MSLHESKKMTILDKKQPLLDQSNNIELTKPTVDMHSFANVFDYKGVELDIDFRVMLPDNSFGGKYFLENYINNGGRKLTKKILFQQFK